MEEKKLASIIIEFVTAINQQGLDIYFLNRQPAKNVTNMMGLQNVFSSDPNGGTPLGNALQTIYKDNNNLGNKQLLIIVITDGEPTDMGSVEKSKRFLKQVLLSKGSNVHVSFVECTDNEEDMDYLDSWDNQIPLFDNTDDYREELRRVRQTKGINYKFDYVDYVIKILLATFVKKYFMLDQGARLGDVTYQGRDEQYIRQDGCCIVC